MTELLRVRFKANDGDPRPINWPIKHPYWITGYGDNYSVIVAYADNKEYIFDNWPEAKDLEIKIVDGYVFTSRFPKPEWFDSTPTKAGEG